MNMITRKEAVEILGVTTVTLWNWEKKGMLIPLKDVGGHVYYKQEEVDRILEKKQQEGKQLRGRQ